ncbi:hypothetical protein [Aeoliella sp.]|uniref:hypothetical protein n=1 Tax=Aeoliella sp. TaxID=2795800 RepID=UPI003CCC1835
MSAESHVLSGLDQVISEYGFTGEGQTVAMIGSGVAYDHVALGGGLGSQYRVVGGWDFAENDADPYDDSSPLNGSGTHEAGVVAGGVGYGDSGVAPGVDLVALRVFDDTGYSDYAWIESALQWVHDNRNSFEDPITTVSISLGADYNDSSIPGWATLEDEFAQLEADGIFVAVAAGNGFQDYEEAGLSYPAVSPYVVPVMSVDDGGALSFFSQRHTSAIAAPGRFIASAVPDWAGNNDSTVDDVVERSGTNAAAPYLAGASVLVREAMESLGSTGITQDDIYNQIMATADSIYDSATQTWYQRLDLYEAISDLMPDDDYGSDPGSAHDLGTLSSNTQINGTIGTSVDVDYFKFTPSTSGQVKFTVTPAAGLTHTWIGGGYVSGSNSENYTLNVVAGQTYTFGLGASSGTGDYTIDATVAYASDWGTVQGQLTNADVSSTSQRWFRFVAGQAGYVTVEASFSHAAGNVNLYLKNANQQNVGQSTGTGNTERIDYVATAGQELLLQVVGTNADIDFVLSNMVAVNGSTLNVTGTSGDDVFTMIAGTTHQVVANGVSYQFDSASVSNIVFSGQAGTDTATITGTTGADNATYSVGLVTLAGTGYSASAQAVENVTINGGGGSNYATMYDTTGDETLTGYDYQTTFVGANRQHVAAGFSSVTVHTSGGTDRAYLHGTTGDDTFSAWSDRAVLSGSGYFNDARGFDSVTAYGYGGTDRAYLNGTTSNDTFTGWTDRVVLAGTGYFNDARGFESATAYGNGGTDRAYLHGATGDDTFSSWSDRAVLSGTGYFNDARNFVSATAYGYDGNDRAIFHGSTGNDVFSGWTDRAVLTGTGYFNDGRDFENAVAYSNGGSDRAIFHGTTGDETFAAWGNRGVMYGTGYWNDAQGFSNSTAYGNGGNDRAILHGSAADDTFSAWSDRAVLQATGYWNDAHDFSNVTAYGDGGTDRGYFHGTAGDDTFAAWDNRGVMFGAGYWNDANGFGYSTAYGNGGNDIAHLHGTAGNDTYAAWSDRAVMLGTGFFNEAVGFQKTTAYAYGGTTDRAILHDSADDDTVVANQTKAYIYNSAFHNEAQDFDRVEAWDDNTGDDDTVVNSGTLDYVFALIGDWS